MGNAVERFPGTGPITYTAGATPVVGGALVEISTPRTVIPGTADSKKIVGVALYNAATGKKVAVACAGVWDVPASGSINAGDRVVAAASGAVKAAAATIDTSGATAPLPQVVGIAITDAADSVVTVRLAGLS